MARPHISPNQREILYVTDSATGNATYITATNHALDVNASISLSGSPLPISGATTAVGVAIVDGSGNQITSFGGGTQYADGAARGTATGTLMMVDDGVNIQSAAGTTAGLLKVDLSGTAANGTAIKVDGSAVTQPVSGTVTANAGTNLNTSALALAAIQTDKSQFTKLTDGTDTALITAAGEQNVIATAQPGVDIGDVTINNATGAAAVNIQDGGNSITVDGTVAVSTLPATFAEDAPHTTGDLGVQVLTKRTDTAATSAGTDGDYATFNSDSLGRLWVRVGGTDTLTPGTAAFNLGKAEDAAHTTGDTGVFALGVRNDTLADVTSTTADYSQLSTDIKGRVITAGAPRSLKGTAQVSISNTTTETTILAGTASTFHDVYGLILANTGATTTKVSIRDDTLGTVRAIIEVPTLETRGFMLPVDSAIPQTAVNKNWTAQCASATTTLEVTLLYVSMV